MYIKNLIQQNIELAEAVGKMRNNILMTESKYDISGCVLGQTGELTTGYLTNLKEYDNINEAVDNIDALTKALYFTGEKYIIGQVVSAITECQAGKYLDINTLKFEVIE
jgi:hypothetical protein